jgi:hypothetical protein
MTPSSHHSAQSTHPLFPLKSGCGCGCGCCSHLLWHGSGGRVSLARHEVHRTRGQTPGQKEVQLEGNKQKSGLEEQRYGCY